MDMEVKLVQFENAAMLIVSIELPKFNEVAPLQP